jgi:hypothetical protein
VSPWSRKFTRSMPLCSQPKETVTIIDLTESVTVHFFGGPDDGCFHRWTFFWCSVSFDEPMFHPLFNSLQLLFLIGVLYQKHKRESHTTSLVFICEPWGNVSEPHAPILYDKSFCIKYTVICSGHSWASRLLLVLYTYPAIIKSTAPYPHLLLWYNTCMYTSNISWQIAIHSAEFVCVRCPPELPNIQNSQSLVMLFMYSQFTFCYSGNTLHPALVLCPSCSPEKVGVNKKGTN